MKTNYFKKIAGGVIALLLCFAMGIQAQQRYGGGGGGGGFGGFGGFGGGGGFNRGGFGGGGSSTTSAYNNNGTVGNAVIQVDPLTHNIIVIADKATSEQIQQVIENLDAPVQQVLIKVVFLEVQHNNGSIIGVQGSYNGGSMANTVSQLTNNFGLPQALSGASGSGAVYQLLGNDFTATVQAIAASGKSQILSRPSILARDGQMAQIVVGQEIYLPSGVSYSTAGNSSVAIPVINGTYQNVGIILNVTPFIGANGLVQMILQPQTSELDTSSPGQIITFGSGGGLLSSSTAVFAPNVNIRSADTVVVTPDGQTVVIGGLLSNTKSSADSKVPFLGDIPLLGQLFKSSTKADSKTELLMFLTPHIVKAPTLLPGMTPGEINQTTILTNSVSEQELDRFLEHVPMKKSKNKSR
jgi:general secretion pathway protein D